MILWTVYTQAQAIEGYGCKCGFKTADKNDFGRHLRSAGKRDGRGIHRSIGRINLQTGEVIMPPWSERTEEQKTESRYAKKTDTTIKPTDVLANAQELRFVPRVCTTDYTPIMRAAEKAEELV